MVITNLKDLIDLLTEIYNEEGDMKTVVMRSGKSYPEIELNVVGDTVYIEAYLKDEEYER